MTKIADKMFVGALGSITEVSPGKIGEQEILTLSTAASVAFPSAHFLRILSDESGESIEVGGPEHAHSFRGTPGEWMAAWQAAFDRGETRG